MDTLFKFKKKEDDCFYKEIQEEVSAYFRYSKLSIKANSFMKIKAALLLIGVGSLYLIILLEKISAFLLPFALILLGILIISTAFNICHDALHNAFFQKSRKNRNLGYITDLIGPSSYLWNINHGKHHSYTNVHGMDGDIKDSSILRLCPYAPYKPMHRYQLVSVIFIYSSFFLILIYGLNMINITGRNFGNNQTVKHHPASIIQFVLLKLIYICIWIVIPISVMNLNFSQFITGYLLLNITISICFTLVFMVAHGTESVTFRRNDSTNEEVSWAEHQIKTTANFKAKGLVNLLLGGLNYQIEHHLFPNMSSVHYSKISPIVQKVCKKYQIPYHVNPSFFKALILHFRFLHKMSLPPILPVTHK